MSEIGDILTKVKQGMARTNLFKIIIPYFGLTDLTFHGKGTQLPSSELGVLEIPHRGRRLKVPGQRTFSEWTVTIMETSSMEVRSKLESWMNKFDDAKSGVMDKSFQYDAVVALQDPTVTEYSVLWYTLYGIFPTNIGAVELSFDEQTAPLEYQVTFNYSYHTMSPSDSDGDGGE